MVQFDEKKVLISQVMKKAKKKRTFTLSLFTKRFYDIKSSMLHVNDDINEISIEKEGVCSYILIQNV